MPKNWREVPKDLKQHGGQEVRIFITDDPPGLGEALKLPRWCEPLCPPCRAGCAKQGAEEGPRRFGRGPQEDLSGRDTRRGCGSFAELAE